MPRGRKVQHKGRGKRYLTEEEIRIAEERKRREKGWKLKKGLGEESEEEKDGDTEGAVAGRSKGASHGLPGELPPSDSSEELVSSEEEEEKQPKQKGVDGVIEVENPNRQAKKAIKAKDIDLNAKVELTRREREEIEKQRAAKAYAKRHEEGRTEEAQRDLARLAIIRQKREEAAKKREEATKKREESAKASNESGK